MNLCRQDVYSSLKAINSKSLSIVRLFVFLVQKYWHKADFNDLLKAFFHCGRLNSLEECMDGNDGHFFREMLSVRVDFALQVVMQACRLRKVEVYCSDGNFELFAYIQVQFSLGSLRVCVVNHTTFPSCEQISHAFNTISRSLKLFIADKEICLAVVVPKSGLSRTWATHKNEHFLRSAFGERLIDGFVLPVLHFFFFYLWLFLS